MTEMTTTAMPHRPLRRSLRGSLFKQAKIVMMVTSAIAMAAPTTCGSRLGDGIWRRDLFETEPAMSAAMMATKMKMIAAPVVRSPRCGDGLQQTDEACDDGNTVQTDSCLNDCTMARCGDGVIQDGVEQCDGSEDCSEGCILMTCGNGVVEGTEVCDDGNEVLTDACANCRPARCGDGLVRSDKALGEAGYEACDDGNTDRSDCSVVLD